MSHTRANHGGSEGCISKYEYLDLRTAARYHGQVGNDYAFEHICAEICKEFGEEAEAYVRTLKPEISRCADVHQPKKATATKLNGSLSSNSKSSKTTPTTRTKVLPQSADSHVEDLGWVDAMDTIKVAERELEEGGWVGVVIGEETSPVKQNAEEDWTLL